MTVGYLLSQVPYTNFNHLANNPNLVISEAVFHATSYQYRNPRNVQSEKESKRYNSFLAQLTDTTHPTRS
jgi:hypothetical protein